MVVYKYIGLFLDFLIFLNLFYFLFFFLLFKWTWGVMQIDIKDTIIYSNCVGGKREKDRL